MNPRCHPACGPRSVTVCNGPRSQRVADAERLPWLNTWNWHPSIPFGGERDRSEIPSSWLIDPLFIGAWTALLLHLRLACPRSSQAAESRLVQGLVRSQRRARVPRPRRGCPPEIDVEK